MTLTPTRLAELRSIERAATPGPWRSSHKTAFDTPIDAADLSGPEQADRKWCGAPGRYVKADADLIAEARNALPHLLDELEAARAKLDAINETVEAQLLIAAPLSPIAELCCELRNITGGRP